MSRRYVDNADWLKQEREAANTVPCPDCHAAAGEACRNPLTGEPLKRFPAHTQRITAARKVMA